MFKHLISTSSGTINWIALMMLVSFFFIFTLIIVLIFFLKKDHAKYMANLPLDYKSNLDEQAL